MQSTALSFLEMCDLLLINFPQSWMIDYKVEGYQGPIFDIDIIKYSKVSI